MDLEGPSLKIVVTSCFAYRDAWEPFAQCFSRMWPDRPDFMKPVLAVDENRGLSWSGGPIVSAGRGASFSETVRLALEDEEEEAVTLLLQEDFFLGSPVDTRYVVAALDRMIGEPEIGCFRLMPCPGPDEPIGGDPESGEIAIGAPYRVSCQAALWRVRLLGKILARTTSASSFELEGTKISRSYRERFLSVPRERNPLPLAYPVTGILRGKWNPDALELFRRLEIPVDRSLREVHGT